MIQIRLERIGDAERAYLELGRRLCNKNLGRGVGETVIGHPPRREWCAEIIGLNADGTFRRRFLKANVSYAQANSIGSRGVYAYYNLHDAKVYEISSPISWRRTDHYFCRVNRNELVRMANKEVQWWLSARSELTF